MSQPGFKRDELRPRYDVASILEDEWHAYSGAKTAEIVKSELLSQNGSHAWLLNAGSGTHALYLDGWREITLDLFAAPMRGGQFAVCGSIERLPFPSNMFAAAVCVGEVLAYCDPAAAISEFARVLASRGLLVCDFGNSRSLRKLLNPAFGRAADLITDHYNGTPERTWVYNPAYIKSLLTASGFTVQRIYGIHTWSALARRFGCSAATSVAIQRRLEWLPLPPIGADLTTVVAVLG